jgi:hypothetical protein
MSGTSDRVDALRAALYLRVLNGDLGAAQLWFDQHVLDRYRAQPASAHQRATALGAACGHARRQPQFPHHAPGTGQLHR